MAVMGGGWCIFTPILLAVYTCRITLPLHFAAIICKANACVQRVESSILLWSEDIFKIIPNVYHSPKGICKKFPYHRLLNPIACQTVVYIYCILGYFGLG